MIRVFVRHTVEDFARWRQAYDGMEALRQAGGVQAQGVFQALDDPNDVTIWHDFETRDKAEAFITSEALGAALAEAGVTGEPIAWLTQPA